MDQERFRDLGAEFLLSDLAGPELAEFEAELERRGEAGRAELAAMREALAALALAPPAARPSTALRQRLLERIAGEAEEPASGEARGAARIVPLRRAPWEWMLAAGVAAALAALLALWNVRLREDLARAEEELAGERLQLAAADSAAAELEATRRDLAALVSPRATAHTLTGTENQPGAVARIFVDPVTGRALLFAFDLPILPPGEVYELWAIKGGTPVAAGTFSTGDERPARIELEDPDVLQGAEALAVTVEPAPGVPAPTGKMVLITS